MDFEQRAEFILQSIESHDRQLGELTDRMSTLTANVEKLVVMSNRDAIDIAALARIAEAHQRRLERLEEDRPEH